MSEDWHIPQPVKFDTKVIKHVTSRIESFMIDHDVDEVIRERWVGQEGWECDCYSWVCITRDGNDIEIRTDHGQPFICPL